jgi:signal transduction histidine kinase
MGLGLAKSKNIVENFGGEISFTSELGKGSQFKVWLPRA